MKYKETNINISSLNGEKLILWNVQLISVTISARNETTRLGLNQTQRGGSEWSLLMLLHHCTAEIAITIS